MKTADAIFATITFVGIWLAIWAGAAAVRDLRVRIEALENRCAIEATR